MDGEHIVSAAAFGREDRDANLKVRIDFQRGRVLDDGTLDTSAPGGFDRPMTVNTLTAKVLCKQHNHRLSEVDAEAGKLTDAIMDFRRLWQRRLIRGLAYTDKRSLIDGLRIERWFIKTLAAITAHDGLPLGSKDAEVGTPTDELVDIAFGLREPSGHIGLAGAAALGPERVQINEFSFEPIHYVPPTEPAKRYIVGCTADFRGFRFVLNVDRDRTIPLAALRKLHGWEHVNLSQPLRSINALHMNLGIRFVWPAHRPGPRP